MKPLLVAAAVAALVQQQQYRERVDVARVLIDVRVEDGEGKPVPGLSAADFAVTIGRKPAPIDSVERVGSAGASGDPAAVAAADASPSAPAPRSIVLLYQKKPDLSEVGGLMRLHDDFAEFVDAATAVPSRIAVASFDTRLHLWLDFTSDREQLRRVILHDMVVGGPPPIASAPTLAERLSPQDAWGAQRMETALTRLGDALAPLPGAKDIVMLGYGMNDYVIADMPNDAKFTDALASLAAARISVYCIDIVRADYHPRGEALRRLAEESGGLYFQSHIFTKAVFDRLSDALSGRYVLLVVPPDGLRDQQEIDVKLVRRKGTVVARRWYFAR